MIFLDTGPIIAAYDARDKWRRIAMPEWDRLDALKERFVTTDRIVLEAVSFLAKTYSRHHAAQVARAVLNAPRFLVERITSADDLAALSLFEAEKRYKGATFVDCSSFVVARRFGVDEAFTFDYEHFPAAGLKPVTPRPAAPPA